MYALSDPREEDQMEVGGGTFAQAITSTPSTFVFPLLCPLQQLDKCIPLRYAPCEFVCDISPDALSVATGSFTISDVQLLATTYEMDSALQESIHEHLLSGKNLMLPLNCWLNGSQALAGPTQKVHVGSNKARLNKAFITFKGSADVEVRDLRLPTGALEIDMSLGSKRVPENTMTSLADFWATLMKTIPRGSMVDIDRAAYTAPANASKKFIVGVPFERLPMFAQGANQKGGDLLTCSIKNAGSVDEVFISCEFSAVVEISDSQIAVYD